MATGQYLLIANTFGPEEGAYQMTLDCQTTGSGGLALGAIGTWYDPSHDGEGWKIEVINDTSAVIYWFTYPPPGASLGQQSWMVAVGTIQGDSILVDEVTITDGPSFGPGFDPNDVNREVEPEYIQRIANWVTKWMPAAAPRATEAAVCLYTNTPDLDFVLDRHPRHPQVVVAGGFSGHGFKFSILVGDIVADLVIDGTTRRRIDRFGISRFDAAAGES